MASTIFIRALASGTGVDIYIASTTKNEYTGSGTPWTDPTTTPYRLAMNDKTGPRWTPTVAEDGIVFGGGLSLLDGTPPLYDQHGNVIETIPLQCYGSSFDNAMAVVRFLRGTLAAALWVQPPILVVQPNGSTNQSNFEILSARLQETPDFINDEAGHGFVRATLTITRAPFASASSLTTLLNSVTYTNVGTGSNNNTQSLGINALSATSTQGERVYQGQPLNITITPAASVVPARFWMASVLTRVYTSVNVARTTTTSSNYYSAGSEAAVTLSASTYYNTLARGRMLARFTTFTQLDNARFEAFIYDSAKSAVGTLLWRSGQFAYTDNTTAATAFIDFGWFDLSFLRRRLLSTTAPQISVNVQLASDDGTSVTATLDYFEILEYYDFCRLDGNGRSPTNTAYLAIEQTNSLNGQAQVPSRPPVAYVSGTSNDQPTGPWTIRGQLPRGYAGASLYLSWLDGAYEHDKTETVTVLANMLPQYFTMRGSG